MGRSAIGGGSGDRWKWNRLIDSVYSSRRLGWNELWIGNENLAEFRQPKGGFAVDGLSSRKRERERDMFILLLYMTYIIDARIENRWDGIFLYLSIYFPSKKENRIF